MRASKPPINRVPYITLVRVKASWLYLGVLVLQQKMSDPVLYCDRLKIDYFSYQVYQRVDRREFKAEKVRKKRCLRRGAPTQSLQLRSPHKHLFA